MAVICSGTGGESRPNKELIPKEEQPKKPAKSRKKAESK